VFLSCGILFFYRDLHIAVHNKFQTRRRLKRERKGASEVEREGKRVEQDEREQEEIVFLTRNGFSRRVRRNACLAEAKRAQLTVFSRSSGNSNVS
jgi:hypothetical protein